MCTVLVSACLLGIRCRYDGRHAYRKTVADLIKKAHVIFACPEQLGGLTTPRAKNRIEGEKVVNELGDDVTEHFYRGAREFLEIARLFKVRTMILKSNSPSCGKHGVIAKLMSRTVHVRYIR